MPYKSRNSCCALAQMCVMDQESVESIKICIERAKAESEQYTKWLPVGYSAPATGGERALFCITTPAETNLEKKLEEAGFRYLTSINRRYCYQDHGTAKLKMWIYNW